jgi:hypothetical protein
MDTENRRSMSSRLMQVESKVVKKLQRKIRQTTYKDSVEIMKDIPRDYKFYEIRSGLSQSTINELKTKMPVQYFYILLKQIAIHLDLEYKHHIKYSKSQFILNEKLKPQLIDSNLYPNYWKIDAVFRNRASAVAACIILRDLKKEIFGE